MTNTATNLDYPAGDTLCKGIYHTPTGRTGPCPWCWFAMLNFLQEVL